MDNELKTELYKCIKQLTIENLNEADKKDLLRVFVVTKNSLIRDHISMIFSDLQFNEAIPFIIKKINDKTIAHNNGTLVYSLENLDCKRYFIMLIKIICEREFEPRLWAYGIVQKYIDSITSLTRKRALRILEEHRLKLELTATEKGEDSTLHFIEQTQKKLL